MSSDGGRPTLSPSSIGQFFSLQSCPMYLKWKYDEEGRARLETREWEPDSMSSVLASEGDSFELTQLRALDDGTRAFLGLESDAEELSSAGIDAELAADDELPERMHEAISAVADSPAGARELIVHQPPIRGAIGAYSISGKGDILRVQSTKNGVKASVFEVKSSSQQKVHHRYQATIYAVLLNQQLTAAGIEIDGEISTKIVTPANDLSDGPDAVDGFDTAPYRAKLELKLEAGGSFDQTFEQSFEETNNRIARRCAGCEFEPQCMTRGVESLGLELLGLQAGTQEQLQRLGITTIRDFADLFEQDPYAVHWDYGPLEPADEDLVQRVRRETDITNLQKRAQIAFRFLADIESYDFSGDHGLRAQPLKGTGNNLPEDEHGQTNVDWTESRGVDYPSGSLVRVYLYVQQDFAQDRVTILSAHVTNSLSGEHRHVTELPTSIPTSDREKNIEERRLFETFFRSLTDAITEVAPDLRSYLGEDSPELAAGEGFLHLYIYSDSQRQALMDAIRRHPEAAWRRPLRTLLGLRAGIDQEMVSVLQDDFRRRWALRFPGLGTLQTTAQFQLRSDWFDWAGRRDDGSTVATHEIFDVGLFDSAVTVNEDGTLDHSRPRAVWTPDDRSLSGDVYPIRNREADSIPVEYIWGVNDRLAPEAADDPEVVERYLYRDDDRNDRITDEDLELLAQRFAMANFQIERSIENTGRYANDRFVKKEPVNFAELAEFSFEERSLTEACIEYQQLEYHTKKEQLEGYYSQPLEERLDSGASLAFECTAVDADEGVIRGNILASDLEPTASRAYEDLLGESLGVSGGDFMVMTRLTGAGDRAEDVYRGDPTNIQNSTTVIVSDVDGERGTVELSAPFDTGWPNQSQYMVNHSGWSADADAVDESWTTYVGLGERFVLDPGIDNISQNRAYEALANARDAPVHRWLQEIYSGTRERIPTDRWDSGSVGEYVEAMGSADCVERPNAEQSGLITDTDNGIVMLQGPPGTGKTQYTTAPAVLGRVHADVAAGEKFVGAFSAVSHTAVDEALESILELREHCPPGVADDQPELVRVCSGPGQGIDDPRVREVHYNDADAETFQELYELYFAPDAPSDRHAVFFAPPVSMRGLVKNMLYAVDELDYDGMESFFADGYATGEATLFDLVVVDEASMMDLPLCLLIGSFLADNGQLLLVGDHRQMQPIQQHEWVDEDREPIERNVPFLSALDFLRHLRGEDVELEFVEESAPDLPDPDETFPVHRLRETFRLPDESARMHTDLFYRQDDIELTSVDEKPTLPSVDGRMADVLNGDDRIVLIVHDENTSQKSNPVEQALVAQLLDPLPIVDVDTTGEGITAGVVVPFRAQRRDVLEHTPAGAAVDTVERFQGGERDMMVLSMTASDRGYISGISEFLLDPKRFNVGASRMKRKLVVLASAGLFEESSNDVDAFEEQQAWINFYRSMGGLEGDCDTYALTDFLDDSIIDSLFDDGAPDTTVKVYSGYTTPVRV